MRIEVIPKILHGRNQDGVETRFSSFKLLIWLSSETISVRALFSKYINEKQSSPTMTADSWKGKGSVIEKIENRRRNFWSVSCIIAVVLVPVAGFPDNGLLWKRQAAQNHKKTLPPVEVKSVNIVNIWNGMSGFYVCCSWWEWWS